MSYPITFVNSILSNNAYVYQSLENLGTMGGSSRTGVISVIYKKSDEEDFTNYRPISLIDPIIYLFLNISYIILYNGHFCNFKTNQLLSKKELYYTLFLLYMT